MGSKKKSKKGAEDVQAAETAPATEKKQKKLKAVQEEEALDTDKKNNKKKKSNGKEVEAAEPVKKKKKSEGGDEEVEETEKKKKKKKRKDTHAIDAKVEEENEQKDTHELEVAGRSKKKKVDVDAADEEPLADHQSSNCCVFIGGLPYAATEDVLQEDFGECGEIVELRILRYPETGHSKGMALITYKNPAGVKAALAYDGDNYGGRILEVRLDKKGGVGGEGGSKDGKGKGKADSQFEIFVRGLGPTTKEHGLEKEFSKCGKVERVKMDIDIGNGGKCKGYAWITFVSKSGLDSAIELNNTVFGGRTITVEKSGQHKAKGAGKGGDASSGVEVFVRGLPLDLPEDILQKDFMECGPIAKINMPRDSDGSCKGFAWITFETQEGADKAVAFNGDVYGGKKLMVEVAGQHRSRAQSGKGKPGPGAKPAGCTSVVVKCLSYNAIEADLFKAFAKCGSGPSNVKILTDWDSGKSKGMAFVDFADEKAVDQAIKLIGTEIKGRPISMDYAKPRKQ